jgi:thiamine pyrophosphokinase
VLEQRETHQKRITTRAIIFSDHQPLNQQHLKQSNNNRFIPTLLKEFRKKTSTLQSSYIESTTQLEEIRTILIAVDGGANYLHNLEIVPDMIIGDMDSIRPETLEFYRNLTEIKRYPTRKEATDTELALNWCIECNESNQADMVIDEVLFINALQGSFAHSLGVLTLLFRATEHSIRAVICNNEETVLLVPEKWHYRGKAGNKLSLIPLTERVTGVVTKGLEYPLKNEILYRNSTRGISNVFIDGEINVCYEKGRLLAIIEGTPEDIT